MHSRGHRRRAAASNLKMDVTSLFTATSEKGTGGRPRQDFHLEGVQLQVAVCPGRGRRSYRRGRWSPSRRGSSSRWRCVLAGAG